MKKRLLPFLIVLLFFFSLSGCKIKSTDIPLSKKKPSLFYYTELMAKELVSNSKYSGFIFETNLNKEIALTPEGLDIIKGFLKSLHSSNFIQKPDDLPERPQYRIYLGSKEDKYIINVYNEKYISVHPWDGVHSSDFIEMKDVSQLYNLQGLCKYYYK